MKGPASPGRHKSKQAISYR